MTISQASKKIKSALKKKINSALSEEVFKAVQKEEIEAIKKKVYEVYEPAIYDRRMAGTNAASTGMLDPENIIVDGGTAKKMTLTVKNVTLPNPSGVRDQEFVTVTKTLPELIEYGHTRYVRSHASDTGYDWPYRDLEYFRPRPFTAETIRRLKSNRKHVRAMREGLNRQGVKTK